MREAENQYAGFWIRSVAFSIDSLLLGVVSCAITYLFFSVVNILKISDYTFEMYFYSEAVPSAIEYCVILLTSIASVVIVSHFLVSKWHATPSKRLLGIYVVDTDLKPLALKQALLRTVLPYLLVALLIPIEFALKNVDLAVLEQDSIRGGISEEVLIADDKILRELLPLTTKKMTDLGESDYFLIDNILNEPDIKTVFENEKSTLNAENRKQVDELYNKFTQNGESTVEGNNKMPYLPVFLVLLFICWSLLVFIWYAVAGFTKEKTAIHDIIAKTRVIKGRL